MEAMIKQRLLQEMIQFRGEKKFNYTFVGTTFSIVWVFLIAFQIYANIEKTIAPGSYLLTNIVMAVLLCVLLLVIIDMFKTCKSVVKVMTELIQKVESKTEEELTKQWKSEDNVPLIKLDKSHYYIPGHSEYKEVFTEKFYFTEWEALMDFKYPAQ